MIVFDTNINVFEELYTVESFNLPRRVLYQYQVPDQARRLGWKETRVFTGPSLHGTSAALQTGAAHSLLRLVLHAGLAHHACARARRLEALS